MKRRERARNSCLRQMWLPLTQIYTPMPAVLMACVPAASMVERNPLGRYGEVDEVASEISFVSSGDASFLTRQMPSDNGGILMA
jgi:NAD(P)-dependent dehydrogenase (short-subunit alcohol dehydrogenase family)